MLVNNNDIMQEVYGTFNPKPEEGTEAYQKWYEEFLLWCCSDTVSQLREMVQKSLNGNGAGLPFGGGICWSDEPAFPPSLEEQELLDRLTANIFSIEKDMQKYYGLALEYLERFGTKDTVHRIFQLNYQTFEEIRNIKKAVDRSCDKLYG